VPVATDHVEINSGFSMPHITGWFSDKSTLFTCLVVSDQVVTGTYHTNFYILCSQFDKRFAPKGCNTCELLIFQRSAIGKHLINLRSGDLAYMPDVLKWYASCKNYLTWFYWQANQLLWGLMYVELNMDLLRLNNYKSTCLLCGLNIYICLPLTYGSKVMVDGDDR
jgi:hypothetical protein